MNSSWYCINHFLKCLLWCGAHVGMMTCRVLPVTWAVQSCQWLAYWRMAVLTQGPEEDHFKMKSKLLSNRVLKPTIYNVLFYSSGSRPITPVVSDYTTSSIYTVQLSYRVTSAHNTCSWDLHTYTQLVSLAWDHEVSLAVRNCVCLPLYHRE